MTTSHQQHESHRLRGGSLVAKLTVAFVVLVGVFMLVFQFVLSNFVEEAVAQRVLRQAADAARSGALADLEAWAETFDTVDQGRSLQKIYEAGLKMSTMERRLYDEDEVRLAQVEWNKGRMRRFLQGDSEIQAVEVLRKQPDGSNTFVAKSYTEDMLQFRKVLGGVRGSFGQARAAEGVLQVDGEDLRVIRGSHPVRDVGGDVVGEFGVYIAASSIGEATDALKLKVTYVAVAFVLIGAVAANLMGRTITGPLRRLQEDVHIVARGQLDHHTHPHSHDEIGQLARAVDSMTRSLREARDAEREAAASRHELEVAAEVAARLTPASFPSPPGWDVFGLQHERKAPPAEYADCVEMADGRVGFLVAGASGSGVPATMVLAMARSYLRVVAASERDPGAVLRRVNELLSGDMRQGMYVTAMLVVVEPGSSRLQIANAGHPPLVHWAAQGEKLEVVHSEGIALGFDSGPVFDRTLKTVDFDVADGDRLVLYAPGLMQVANREGKPLGERNFLGLVAREAPLISESFIGRMDHTLHDYAGSDDLGKDVTLLTMARLPS